MEQTRANWNQLKRDFILNVAYATSVSFKLVFRFPLNSCLISVAIKTGLNPPVEVTHMVMQECLFTGSTSADIKRNYISIK